MNVKYITIKCDYCKILKKNIHAILILITAQRETFSMNLAGQESRRATRLAYASWTTS